MGFAPAPDLSGECPPDWQPRKWLAAQELAQGATSASVAELVGVKTRTIQSWKQQWREKYGEGWIPRPDPLRRYKWNNSNRRLTDEARQLLLKAETVDSPGLVAAAETRVLARESRVAALMLLQEILEDPLRRSQVTVRDVAALLGASRLLDAAAESMGPKATPLPDGPLPEAGAIGALEVDVVDEGLLIELEHVAHAYSIRMENKDEHENEPGDSGPDTFPSGTGQMGSLQ